jgi:ubiquinone/menaquinone biosynthesis C-methylase UbiE
MYVFDNAGIEAAERLRILPEIYDAETTRHLAARGVGPGWNCLEIGGGKGSVGQWLSEQVRPGGHVLITDIDPRHVSGSSSSNVEIRCHDIQRDSLPEKSFDLIHARLVLIHLPERERVLARIFSWLKPGGWLVLEEFQTLPFEQTVEPADSSCMVNAANALRQVNMAAGVDPFFARSMTNRMRSHGFIDVAKEGRSFAWRGRSAGTTLLRLNCEQTCDVAVAKGFCTENDIASYLERLADPKFEIISPIMWSAWGRRPMD